MLRAHHHFVRLCTEHFLRAQLNSHICGQLFGRDLFRLWNLVPIISHVNNRLEHEPINTAV